MLSCEGEFGSGMAWRGPESDDIGGETVYDGVGKIAVECTRVVIVGSSEKVG